MKTKLFVVCVLAASLCLMALPCFAEDANSAPNVQDKAMPSEKIGSLDINDRIDIMLNRLAEVDPVRADALRTLRKEDPERFRAQMREEFRERMGERFKDRMDKQHPGMRDKMPMPAGPDGAMPMPGVRPDRGDQRDAQKQAEFQKWLQENYPDAAKKLESLKTEDPQLQRRQGAVILKKYGRIYEASKRNPELAQVLKDDLVLVEKRDALLKELAAAPAEKKDTVTAELKDVLSQRYDIILKRREIAYTELNKKLQDLQKEASEKQAELEKWKDPAVKSQTIDAHLKELTSGKEQFKWD